MWVHHRFDVGRETRSAVRSPTDGACGGRGRGRPRWHEACMCVLCANRGGHRCSAARSVRRSAAPRRVRTLPFCRLGNLHRGACGRAIGGDLGTYRDRCESDRRCPHPRARAIRVPRSPAARRARGGTIPPEGDPETTPLEPPPLVEGPRPDRPPHPPLGRMSCPGQRLCGNRRPCRYRVPLRRDHDAPARCARGGLGRVEGGLARPPRRPRRGDHRSAGGRFRRVDRHE